MGNLPVSGQKQFLRAVCDAQPEDHTKVACVPFVHGCHDDVHSGYEAISHAWNTSGIASASDEDAEAANDVRAATTARAVGMPEPGA
ncbi:hypothetical protein ACFYOT_42605 [Saccharothrix saharensis]|uniref:hypothetical protein n=1 Tax=Saccharothrix saharensis TaxID=571190 RepID=UPI0036A1465E